MLKIPLQFVRMHSLVPRQPSISAQVLMNWQATSSMQRAYSYAQLLQEQLLLSVRTFPLQEMEMLVAFLRHADSMLTVR